MISKVSSCQTCFDLNSDPTQSIFILFYLFLYTGEGNEKERERIVNVWLLLMHPLLGTWPTTQARALSGNQTGDPLVLRLVLNPLSHTSQGQLRAS